ncbi:uncharacterized protein Z518_03288 [Rhinocladiella mackenziei CBS 650.93]|uniref:Epoxide hydrolase N-terminal domain-containing protein n=1 Tax=Rhinocladiella mackenziei CBS 650.93 TaxID=1442369 RepID=A0A0D2IZ05_9EURO|nr:uncharacterized protein Z518_03288 [Rhinocladiella mackenziei CBS 650.93]KIX08631.1 hypothetical protein Z518_03288 [Rhinocladiella mackenziei CBS 650.93]
MAKYSNVPSNASLEVSEFTVQIPESDLQDLKTQLRVSKLGPKTYENLRADAKFGVIYQWMSDAKAYWESRFEWRSVEARINSFPNFTTQLVDDDGSVYKVHFACLFSERQDAIPLMCVHGWPGHFLEFLDILSILKKRYSPRELPYHVVIPSLPGYAFSDTPPLERDWKLEDSARLLHKLMAGLGFGSGYAVQGGDIGSYTTRIMASLYDSCKGMEVNFCVIPCPDVATHGHLDLDVFEKEGLERGDNFAKFGTGYAIEHSTRPATIGFALSASPLALLAWVGEKFLKWTDKPPSLDQILESVTLYWLTETFPRAVYPYRQVQGPKRYMVHSDPKYYCHKPFGYSWFPKEIAPVPKSWAATTGNLVWFTRHSEGGHFAAMEQPEVLLTDIEDFLSQVWSQSQAVMRHSENVFSNFEQAESAGKMAKRHDTGK